MKVELRNVRINQAFSEETLCFKAAIYIDGKKVGSAENAGHGGNTDLHFDDPATAKAFAAFAKAQPPHPSEFGGGPLPMNDEFYIDLLVERVERQKECDKIKKKFATKTLFLLKGENLKTGYRIVNAPYSPAVKTHLERKYGDTLGPILNETPELIDAI